MAQHFTFCWVFRILQQLFKVGSINISIFQMKKYPDLESQRDFYNVLRLLYRQWSSNISIAGPYQKNVLSNTPNIHAQNSFIKYSHGCRINILSVQ